MANGEVTEYVSEVVLGEWYTDNVTGITGAATCITFSFDGTQQVLLERGENGEVKRDWVDSARVLP